MSKERVAQIQNGDAISIYLVLFLSLAPAECHRPAPSCEDHGSIYPPAYSSNTTDIGARSGYVEALAVGARISHFSEPAYAGKTLYDMLGHLYKSRDFVS